jgi:hypothetical protein
VAEIDPDAKQVQIYGRARARRTVRCPLTDKAVIGYRVRIEILDDDDVWKPMVDETRLQEFEVYDDSGEALVHWLGPQLFLRERAAGHLGSDVKRPTFRRLLRIPPAWVPPLENERIHYWATIIPHDGEVFVCGRPFTRANQRGATLGYRALPKQLVLRSTGGSPLLLANCSKEELLKSLKANSYRMAG